jgi:hypothetical protein
VVGRNESWADRTTRRHKESFSHSIWTMLVQNNPRGKGNAGLLPHHHRTILDRESCSSSGRPGNVSELDAILSRGASQHRDSISAVSVARAKCSLYRLAALN